MIEVSRNAKVTCFACLVDSICPEGRVVATVAKDLSAGVPEVFQILGLSPGHTYRVCFSGVRRADAETRVGSFKTPGSRTERLTVHILNGALGSYSANSGSVKQPLLFSDQKQNVNLSLFQTPSLVKLSLASLVVIFSFDGRLCLWDDVLESVTNGKVDMLVHLGGQVRCSDAFKEAWSIANIYAESHLQETAKRAKEKTGKSAKRIEQGAASSSGSLRRILKEKFRAAYRQYWYVLE